MAATISDKLMQTNYVLINKKDLHSSQEHSVKTLLNKPMAIIHSIHSIVFINSITLICTPILNAAQNHLLLLQAAKQNKIHPNHTAPTTWASVPQRAAKTTARPLEVPERRYSTMLKRDSNSNNNTKRRRKPNCAEISKCMDNANLVTPAHTHTEHTSSRRRLISQATSWPSFALNSIPMACACMVRDANSCTVSMIWSQN